MIQVASLSGLISAGLVIYNWHFYLTRHTYFDHLIFNSGWSNLISFQYEQPEWVQFLIESYCVRIIFPYFSFNIISHCVLNWHLHNYCRYDVYRGNFWAWFSWSTLWTKILFLSKLSRNCFYVLVGARRSCK